MTIWESVVKTGQTSCFWRRHPQDFQLCNMQKFSGQVSLQISRVVLYIWKSFNLLDVPFALQTDHWHVCFRNKLIYIKMPKRWCTCITCTKSDNRTSIQNSLNRLKVKIAFLWRLFLKFTDNGQQSNPFCIIYHIDIAKI